MPQVSGAGHGGHDGSERQKAEGDPDHLPRSRLAAPTEEDEINQALSSEVCGTAGGDGSWEMDMASESPSVEL